jgi:hypothetical protein
MPILEAVQIDLSDDERTHLQNKNQIFSILCPTFILVSIGLFCVNTQATTKSKADLTMRGKIYFDVKPLTGSTCNKKIVRVILYQVTPNPLHKPGADSEPYLSKAIANSDSRNNRISGNIDRGYCDYVLEKIPQSGSNYELKASAPDRSQFPSDAPAYCTISDIYSEPIGWKNPIASMRSLNSPKDLKLTRIVAKCQP